MFKGNDGFLSIVEPISEAPKVERLDFLWNFGLRCRTCLRYVL